jgi:hypothetical protein
MQRHRQGDKRRRFGDRRLPVRRHLLVQGQEGRDYRREARMAAAIKYGPLKAYILRKGPMRLALHGGLRDRLIEQIVSDWPVGCPPEKLEEVIRARVSLRLRERYGSVVAVLLLSALANIVIRLVLDWWFSSESNRVVMAGWVSEAR